MATVVQILNDANPDRVVEIYRAEYYDDDGTGDGWADVDTFIRFRKIVNDAVGIQNDMVVVITATADAGEIWFDVSGRKPDSDTSWGLEFDDWGDWKLREVEVPDPMVLNVDQQAAHIFHEMTWAGWPEQIEARRDALQDQVEQIDRGLVELTPFNPEDYKDGDND